MKTRLKEEVDMPSSSELPHPSLETDPDRAVQAAIERQRKAQLTLDVSKTKAQEARRARQEKRALRQQARAAKETQGESFEARVSRTEQDNNRKELAELRTYWQQLLLEWFPTYRHPKCIWSGPEHGYAASLLDNYGLEHAKLMCAFIVHNWNDIKDHMFRGSGEPVPSIGTLANGKLHTKFASSATEWSEQGRIVDEYEERGKPYEMIDRYNEAKRRLAAIGVKI